MVTTHSESPNTSDWTEYFCLKRSFNLLISHWTEVFANSSVWPNTSDPNTSESEYFGFYYSATIRPIPNHYQCKLPHKPARNPWSKSCTPGVRKVESRQVIRLVYAKWNHSGTISQKKCMPGAWYAKWNRFQVHSVRVLYAFLRKIESL